MLGAFTFIREIMFPDKASMPFSTNAKNEAALHLTEVLSKWRKAGTGRELEEELVERLAHGGQKGVEVELFEVMEERFRGNSNFNCLEFIVNCALEL
ncbi:unnamed protein product [Sphagnum balticum]